MKTCPICIRSIEKENQAYCLNCSWAFEYYFDDLSIEEQDNYIKRLQTFKAIYENSIDNVKSQALEKKLQDKNVLFKELEQKYIELKKTTEKNSILMEISLFVKYAIEASLWLLLLGLLVSLLSVFFQKSEIVFDMFNYEEKVMLVSFGIPVFILGIYIYKRFIKKEQDELKKSKLDFNLTSTFFLIILLWIGIVLYSLSIIFLINYFFIACRIY